MGRLSLPAGRPVRNITPADAVVPVGQVEQARAYTISHHERDDMLRRVAAADVARVISRPLHMDTPDRSVGPASGIGLSRPQQAASAKLCALWRGSLAADDGPRGYPSQVCQPYSPGGRNEPSAEEVERAAQCWRDYNAAMTHIDLACGPRHAGALRIGVIYGQALPIELSWRLREALGELVAYWSLR